MKYSKNEESCAPHSSKKKNLSVTERPCVQVSIVKSEETKVRQEDLSKLLYEVQLLRTQQDNMECQMQDMKQWVDSLSVLLMILEQG